MRSKNAAPVINPSPPMKIRTAITTFPNPVQACSVSTTINPVPVIAEIEVNKAPVGDMKPGSVLDIGRYNNKAPMSATTKKLYTSIIGDVGPRTETSRRPT